MASEKKNGVILKNNNAVLRKAAWCAMQNGVKNRFVIPAQAGIQCFVGNNKSPFRLLCFLDSGLRRNDYNNVILKERSD